MAARRPVSAPIGYFPSKEAMPLQSADEVFAANEPRRLEDRPNVIVTPWEMVALKELAKWLEQG